MLSSSEDRTTPVELQYLRRRIAGVVCCGCAVADEPGVSYRRDRVISRE